MEKMKVMKAWSHSERNGGGVWKMVECPCISGKKLRDKTHGEGKGPLIVVYTPKEPEMIIRCSFVFIWRTFLSLPTSHCVLRMNL